MSFFGKVYTFVGEEHMDTFFDQLGLPTPMRDALAAWKPNQQLMDNGDGTYTLNLSSPERNKSTTFTPGVEYEDNITSERKAKTTATLEGNTLTQVQQLDDVRTLTYKRVFTDTEVKQTFTVTGWDGTAYRNYKV